MTGIVILVLEWSVKIVKSLNPLKPCVMCKSKVTIDYLENQRYRIYCNYCGQWFEFNAPSQMAAEFIYNKIIAMDGDTNDT